VPILPFLKMAVERACCSVISGMFDKLAPPAQASAAAADRLSVTSARHGLSYVRDANLPSQVTARRSQLSTTIQLGRLALASATRQPSPGKMVGAVGALDLVNKSTTDARTAATAKGVNVRNVTTASSSFSTLLQSAIAPPTIAAGDTVDLLTDVQGNVIGVSRAGAVTQPAPPATQPAPPAATAADIAALREQLKAMQDLHSQQAATITALQGQVTQMNTVLTALRQPPR